jgi:1-acyl-sn-glycerol-3-phosphate acyltransferase
MFSEESIWRRVYRRFGTIGTAFVVFLITLIMAPIGLPLTWLMDRVRSGKPVALRMYICLLSILWFELLGAGLALGLVASHWLGPLRSKDRFLAANYRLQWRWGNWLLRSVMRLCKLKLSVTGISELRPGPVIVLIRHVSQCDTLIPPALLSLSQAVRLRYVVKDAVRYDPCLDIVGHNTPNAFVARGADNAGDLKKISDICLGLGKDDGVIIYPEGTRFSQEKKARIAERFREKGDEAGAQYAESLNHLLPPRAGGALTLLAEAPEADVVIVGHTGLESLGGFGDLWCGEVFGNTLRVHCYRIPRAEIPDDWDGQKGWLMDEWKRLDEWISASLAGSA